MEGNGVGVIVGVFVGMLVGMEVAVGTSVFVGKGIRVAVGAGNGVAVGIGAHAASISNTIDTTKIRFIVRILLWVDSVRQGLLPRL